MKDLRTRGTVTPEDQLRQWADGVPVCPNTVGECCPDFSCCRRHLLWPEEKRRLFVAADQATRERMMMGSLVALTRDAGVRAHVIGVGGSAPSPASHVETRRGGVWLNQKESAILDRRLANRPPSRKGKRP
jgi:hypothetical protein